ASVLWRQGTLWLLWALMTPPIILLSVRLSKSGLSLPAVLALHVVLGSAVAAGILCAEIALIEAGQTADQTARMARRVQFALEGRGPGEGRPPGERPANGYRGDPERRDPERSNSERRDSERGDPAPGERRRGRGRGERPGGERDGGERGPGERFRRDRWLAAMNIATGDLVADFRRRWPLRLPRYLLVYFALIGLGLGIRAFLIGRAQERRTARLEADLNQARLDSLRGQLHPHFLFNSLHSVGGLIRTDRGQDALSALASIGDLLRTSLDAKPEQFVPLSREIELVERYLAVESLRLGDRLSVTLDVPEELREAEVPAFIAQPLVENAIKHAIASRTDGGALIVRAAARDGVQLILEVEDDGPGYRPKPGHEGVGLKHVRARLEALFAEDAALEIEDAQGGGVVARLILPLDDLEEGDPEEAGP
ncbi:MAG: histidine kinase, partial [Planctomycetota bacterium]